MLAEVSKTAVVIGAIARTFTVVVIVGSLFIRETPLVLIVVLNYNDKKMTNNQEIHQIVRAELQKAITNEVFPGAAVGIVLPTGKHLFAYAGITPHAPATQETIYDVASVTKSVVTSSIALLFIEKGWLKLTDRVQSFQDRVQSPQNRVQSFQDRVQSFQGSEPITIHHLLTHTLDFSLTLSELKNESASRIIAAVQNAELKSKPGTLYAYVNASSMLLGFELERVAISHGLPTSLDVLARQFIFDPLGMKHSWLGKVPAEMLEQTAPTEIDAWRGGEVRGQVHDESAWKLLTDETGPMYSGAAGLFTTAADLVLFLQAFLNGQVVSKEMLTLCVQDQRSILGTNHHAPIGLGWELEQRHWMGSNISSQTIGKTGYTGSCVVMDLHNSFAVALLCNHVYPRRPVDRTKINLFRQQLLNTIVECIV
jgi:CubicO group peptidase (beta-lactamase class C family)